ncbi:pilus assembly protein TadG-related protein [Arthrobacter sp. efr-133-TYG-104]|uniref:pilus assembly protein TadG-related protein n=1 Tax=Arthrobacter sp. efr-133-TYG-104 TaxID=3040324 RepID=UPI00330628AE
MTGFLTRVSSRRSDEPGVVRAGERGQLTVLIVGFVLLSLLLATVVMAASAVYLEQKRLLSLADGAALAAADSFIVGDIGGESAPATTLVDERVVSSANSYLASVDAFAAHDQLKIGPGTGSDPGGTAVVELTAVAHPPVVSFLVPDGVVVEVKSTARSRLTQ